MGSINGLVDITATSISNSGQFYLGNNLDPGTAGQVIVSAGTQLPAEWGANAATLPNALTMGTNVTLASGNASFDGAIADTINATDNQLTLVGTTPITIASVGLINTIGIDYDGVTIDLDGSDLAVLKVPNDLTINGTVYNGSVPRTILTPDTTYTGSTTIDIDTTTTPYTINVIKVPNDLTINGTVYNGSVPRTILTPDTTYTGSTTIDIDTTTTPYTINVLKVANDLTINGTVYNGSVPRTITTTDTTYTGTIPISISGANAIGVNYDGDTIDLDGADLAVMKVPNDLTINGTVYNGSIARTITTTDTTYTAGTNIGIDGSNKISLKTTIISQNSIQFNINGTSTTLAGSNYPSKPTVCTYLDLTSTTNILPSSSSPETLKSISFVDNVSMNFTLIPSNSNRWVFDGNQNSGTDKLEVDFVATSTHGYLEYGFYANSYNPGVVFNLGVGVATGGTSPFSTTLYSSPVSIDGYKIGLFNGSTSYYSLKEVLDFDGYENVFTSSNFFFNNLTIGTRYRMAIYGRVWSSGSMYINAGGKNSSGYAGRTAQQPTYLKFYEYDSSIGGTRN